MLRHALFGLILAGCAIPAKAGILLAHADQHWQRVDSSPWAVQLGFQVRLAEPGQITTNYAPLGTSAYPFEGIPDDGSLGLFGSGDEGVYTILPTDDIHFAAFELLLTNPANDELAMHLFYWNSEGRMFLSPAVGGVEWSYVGAGAVGADLESVRLNILNIDVAWTGSVVTVDADIRWEFWGTPVPSPAAVVLLLMGAGSIRRRRS